MLSALTWPFPPSQKVFRRELISPDFRWGFSRQARCSLEIKMRLPCSETRSRSRFGPDYCIFQNNGFLLSGKRLSTSSIDFSTLLTRCQFDTSLFVLKGL